MEFNAKKSLGKLIAKGCTRWVYAHLQDPSLVIKVHKPNRKFFNALEWQIWNRYKDEEFGKYLCPCVEFPHSDYLIMARCNPVHAEDTMYKDLVRKLQGYKLEDLKPANCGVYQGRCVLLDYGHKSFTQLRNNLPS